jgi:hypothetical protein
MKKVETDKEMEVKKEKKKSGKRKMSEIPRKSEEKKKWDTEEKKIGYKKVAEGETETREAERQRVGKYCRKRRYELRWKRNFTSDRRTRYERERKKN